VDRATDASAGSIDPYVPRRGGVHLAPNSRGHHDDRSPAVVLLRSAVVDRVRAILAGDVRAAARLMRDVDDRIADAQAALSALHPHTGRARIVGVTGNPGCGKSTLVDRLVEAHRKAGRRVGVVAVDPSSPFSGGAILGDRIRMQRHATDPGVFIRSLATRGHLGGLSRSAVDVGRILDAMGFEEILIETVGVGQDEIEVTRAAHTTVVVTAPGLGDEVQAIKAGILEAADVFCVNKADRDGADRAVSDLEMMLALATEPVFAGAHSAHHAPGALDLAAASDAPAPDGWRPPIVKTVATRAEGVEGLLAAIDRHTRHLATSPDGALRARRRAKEEIVGRLREALLSGALDRLGDEIDAAAERIAAGAEDPYRATEDLVRRLLEPR
jgi:LAO/AO transport system kinase